MIRQVRSPNNHERRGPAINKGIGVSPLTNAKADGGHRRLILWARQDAALQ